MLLPSIPRSHCTVAYTAVYPDVPRRLDEGHLQHELVGGLLLALPVDDLGFEGSHLPTLALLTLGDDGRLSLANVLCLQLAVVVGFTTHDNRLAAVSQTRRR